MAALPNEMIEESDAFLALVAQREAEIDDKIRNWWEPGVGPYVTCVIGERVANKLKEIYEATGQWSVSIAAGDDPDDWVLTFTVVVIA